MLVVNVLAVTDRQQMVIRRNRLILVKAQASRDRRKKGKGFYILRLECFNNYGIIIDHVSHTLKTSQVKNNFYK